MRKKKGVHWSDSIIVPWIPFLMREAEWNAKKRGRKRKPKKMASSPKGEKASPSSHCLSICKNSEGPLHTALITECGQRALG